MAKKKETAKPAEKMKFEDAMEELELIVKQMEEGGLTLEESIERFERGIRLSQVCSKQLEEAELKVEKLTKSVSGELEVEPFENEGAEADDTEAGDQSEEESRPPADEGLLF